MAITVVDNLIAQGLIRMADTISYVTTSAGSELTDQRTTSWTNQICHEFTVTWPDVPTMTEYFAKGGQIRMSADRTAGATNDQNASRTSMLDRISTIIFSDAGTNNTGTLGTGSAFVYSTLTGAYQTIFSATNDAIAYTTDMYSLEAKISGSTITFKACHQDASDQLIDEATDGTLTAYVDSRRHTDTSQPVFATTLSLSAGS